MSRRHQKRLELAHTMNRRQLNRLLASAGLTMVTTPLVSQPVRAAGEVTYFAWAGYDLPELMADYVRKYDGPPDYGIFSDEEGALQKIRGGYRPDVSHLCSYMIERYRDTGLFRPIDNSRLAHYPDLWPQLRDLPIAHTPEGAWFIPFDWGPSSVLFRPDLAPEYAGAENHSWEILFDKKYAGKLTVYDAIDGAVIVAALVAGIGDPFNPSDADIEHVRAELVRQHTLLLYYWTDQAVMEQSMAAGEIVASYAWPSSLIALREQGVPVEYMSPREGTLTWVCGLMMLKDAPGDEQAAYDLIDAMTAPGSGAWLIENYGYGHANRKAFEMVDAARLDDLGMSDPAQMFEKGVFFQAISPEQRQKYIDMFEIVKLGS